MPVTGMRPWYFINSRPIFSMRPAIFMVTLFLLIAAANAASIDRMEITDDIKAEGIVTHTAVYYFDGPVSGVALNYSLDKTAENIGVFSGPDAVAYKIFENGGLTLQISPILPVKTVAIQYDVRGVVY